MTLSHPHGPQDAIRLAKEGKEVYITIPDNRKHYYEPWRISIDETVRDTAMKIKVVTLTELESMIPETDNYIVISMV